VKKVKEEKKETNNVSSPFNHTILLFSPYALTFFFILYQLPGIGAGEKVIF